MTFIPKPKLHHPDLQKNALGYTRRDYEGPVSTLCAGCGHDSISAAIVRACEEHPHGLDQLLRVVRQFAGDSVALDDLRKSIGELGQA